VPPWDLPFTQVCLDPRKSQLDVISITVLETKAADHKLRRKMWKEEGKLFESEAFGGHLSPPPKS
jgi:hypothetical protein